MYDRLFSKANQERQLNGQQSMLDDRHFRVTDVPETTRETALNWFHKIASIRELLPRFYGMCFCVHRT